MAESGNGKDTIILAGDLVGDSNVVYVNGDGSYGLGNGKENAFVGDPQPAVDFIKTLPGAEGKRIVGF